MHRFPFPFLAAFLFLLIQTVHAGQFTVAVLSFSGDQDPAEISSSLSGENLSTLTKGDRITRGTAALRSGNVVFSQSVNLTPGVRFESDTWLRGHRANTSYLFSNGHADVKVHLEELVNVGITKRKVETYQGSGALTHGSTAILGMKQQKTRRSSASRSASGGVSSNVHSSASLVVVAAQYIP